MKVVLASKNPHKLVEISAILKPLDVELVLESDLGVDVEVEETGSTFEAVSYTHLDVYKRQHAPLCCMYGQIP